MQSIPPFPHLPAPPGASFGRRAMLGTGPRPSRRAILGSGMALGLGVVMSACGKQPAVVAAPTGSPRAGGTLRVGLAGGGASDSLDAHAPVNTTDIARVVNLYEPLLYRDENYELQPLLALSATPDEQAMTWTVKLRPGVKFHDGRTVVPRDVVATFKRVTNPDDPKSGATALTILDEVAVTGDDTLEFRLNTPSATFDDSLGQYALGIVPADYDPSHPVGTGPFKAKSFSPGRQSVFTRNEQYWRDNEPYLDEVVILNFDDDDALINALLSTQVDAIGQIPLALTEVIGSDPRIDVLNSETGMWLPFTMRVDRKPFDDVRVRQAFRLVVDREQMVQQVLSGNGRIGNDVFAPFDPGTTGLPQRTRDIGKAKALLTEAGYPNGLEVELVTAPIQSGAVEAAQVFAQQAAEAGIRVKIRRTDATTFFGDDYLKWDFAQDFYYTRNFLPQVDNSLLEKSPYNETHWDKPEFVDLVNRAKATVDDAQRNKLISEAQKMLWDEGGYIVWGHANQADAFQHYVAGLVPNKTGLALSGYEFRRVWLGGTK